MSARGRLLSAILLIAAFSAALPAPGQAPAPATAGDTVLHAADAGKILPPSVFFAGQSASIQLRNSAGIKFAGGELVLAVLVDTSGYSSSVQQKYQAYFIAEVPIEIEGHPLPAGAYGAGFVHGRFGVMDIGGHDLLSVEANRDAELKRPTPLQIIADSSAGRFRLYQGREYVVLSRAGK